MLIVLIYQWSGDSIIVLIMSLLSLFALLALWDRKPWQVAPEDGEWADTDRSGNGGAADRGWANRDAVAGGTDHHGAAALDNEEERVDEPGEHAGPPEEEPPVVRPVTEDSPVWRSRFDIGLDQSGVTGLALGQREPQLWPWDAVASAGIGWSAAIAEGDAVEERVGLHLGLTAGPATGVAGPTGLPGTAAGPNNGTGVEVAQLMFGAEQRPGAVLSAVRRGMEAARIQRSRFHRLSPAERTRQLANALSPDPISLTKHIRSPELLYQDARRALLTNRTLRRISRDADADQILNAFEQLLTAHGAMDLDEAELGPLGAAADRGDSETVYLGADRAAETRGYRLAFVQHGGDDHLLGLLAIDDANDWDGQSVGSGLTTVTLTPPTYR